MNYRWDTKKGECKSWCRIARYIYSSSYNNLLSFLSKRLIQLIQNTHQYCFFFFNLTQIHWISCPHVTLLILFNHFDGTTIKFVNINRAPSTFISLCIAKANGHVSCSSLYLFTVAHLASPMLCVMGGNPHSKYFFLRTIAYWLSMPLGLPWPHCTSIWFLSLTHWYCKSSKFVIVRLIRRTFLGSFHCVTDL